MVTEIPPETLGGDDNTSHHASKEAQGKLRRLYCCEAQEKQHATLNERLLFHGTSYETAVKIALEG